MAAEMIICDTDVMIDYWDERKARHATTKKILEEESGLDNVVLSAITKMELMSGATNKTNLNKINKKLHRYNIALINNDITLTGIELLSKYSLSHKLALADSLIASTAIVTKLRLFTYNVKDFKFISSLKLFKLPLSTDKKR